MTDITPYIVLSKPQLGENIGSTARAMKNFGIEKFHTQLLTKKNLNII